MNLLSLDFVLYFTLFFILYWSLRSFTQIQNYLLLIVSYLFIGAFSINSAIILLIYSLLIYAIADFSRILDEEGKGQRPAYIALLVLVGTFFLAFKYYTPSRERVSEFLSQLGLTFDMPILDILMPLGLSFYIFHSVSYIVSVSKKEIEPSSLADVLLYLSFFPSVVSGPINRAKIFLPQIRPQNGRKLKKINLALALIAWAIAKLFLGSGYLDENYVKGVFSTPGSFEPLEVLIGIYSYAWQIYFNFSGYTSLVTGIALLLGFEVPKNFHAPYIAQNLQEFWKRWHISLSTFIRDYIYIPLGGNRRGFVMQNINLMVAMVLSGIWHGAGINFALWGLLHSIGLIVFNIKSKFFPYSFGKDNFVTRYIGRLITFNYICFAWIFFRCGDFDTALVMLDRLSELSLASLLSADAAMVWSFLIFLAIYPCWELVKKLLLKRIIIIPWFIYPIPLILFLTFVFIFSPDGVPGFIYANF